jgi:hypothetical protein
MDDVDFILTGQEDESLPPNCLEDMAISQEKLFATCETSKLSAKEKQKSINKQHPEIFPVVSRLSDVSGDNCRCKLCPFF